MGDGVSLRPRPAELREYQGLLFRELQLLIDEGDEGVGLWYGIGRLRAL